MDHIKTVVAEDNLHDIALERCDCGQYALSLGPVTLQMEESAVLALSRLLQSSVAASTDVAHAINTPLPHDVQ